MKAFFRASSKEVVEKKILMAALELEQVLPKSHLHTGLGRMDSSGVDSFILLPLFQGAIPCHSCAAVKDF